MNNTVILECTGLGIQNTRRRDIKKIIEQREKMEFDPFKAGFDHKNSLSTIDVTAVRFCFHVILINDDEGKTIVLDPIVTHVMSSILTNNLRIYRLNRCSAPANGGTEITLLCDKVSKKDIKVLLYQKDDNNKIIWKRYADIIGVHRQIGITIKTPKYNRQSTEIIKGFIQLVKPSDVIKENVNF
ncbi:embryonic polarity protein dorsal-like [Aphidius gifuensis]|uniref:embryonic polarity protein dorsal-like n=1 Tax=Aphidius gifuensis TaxID=684658 RepID=UPI001CDB9143|nr:embryonic polarity protein dorsal-like [Aphidius gifuensis]